MENKFTHIDGLNNPTMVDVSDKQVTKRVAIANCQVRLPDEVMAHFKNGDIQSKKGPVFHTAIIAGTQAAKRTDELIPFCHQINLEAVKVNISVVEQVINIDASVTTTSKTGVEMEALMACNVAALTIYDMCKAFSKKMIIEKTHLVSKEGGKSDFQFS